VPLWQLSQTTDSCIRFPIGAFLSFFFVRLCHCDHDGPGMFPSYKDSRSVKLTLFFIQCRCLEYAEFCLRFPSTLLACDTLPFSFVPSLRCYSSIFSFSFLFFHIICISISSALYSSFFSFLSFFLLCMALYSASVNSFQHLIAVLLTCHSPHTLISNGGVCLIYQGPWCPNLTINILGNR
jgi:hypothetical protein